MQGIEHRAHDVLVVVVVLQVEGVGVGQQPGQTLGNGLPVGFVDTDVDHRDFRH